MSRSPHSRGMALALGAGVTISAAALYVAGLKTKEEYSDKSIAGGRDPRVNDNQAMSSSDVAQVVGKKPTGP